MRLFYGHFFLPKDYFTKSKKKTNSLIEVNLLYTIYILFNAIIMERLVFHPTGFLGSIVFPLYYYETKSSYEGSNVSMYFHSFPENIL